MKKRGRRALAATLADQSGRLIELPLILFAYAFVAALVLGWSRGPGAGSLLILMPLGLATGALMSLAISVPRLRLLGVPACAWAYAVLSLGTVPLLLWVEDGRAAVLLLLLQAGGSFWVDLQIARALYARRGEDP